jgi:endoglucanase
MTNAGVRACAGATRPAEDGDLDDFEDRDSRLTPVSGRDGYWWTKKDPAGSTAEPKPLAPVEGGPPGSTRAMHVWGTTASGPGAWGAGVGFNLVSRGAYDASRYAGIAFKARVGAGSVRKLRFKIGDVDTHPDGGVCTSCWNHFGKDLELGTEWQEYRVLFATVKQEDGWGKPRPAVVLPGKLHSIDWSIGTGQTYDLWLDDVIFLDCSPTDGAPAGGQPGK